MPARDADLFMLRLERNWDDLLDGLRGPYGADAWLPSSRTWWR